MNLNLIYFISLLLCIFYLFIILVKPKILENLNFKKDFKHIFIIWFQGFDKMPEICKECYNSWKYKNKDWKIHFIDNSNIHQYIDKKNLFKFKKIKPIQCYADAVRLELIYRYGGLYVDATIFCNKPLDLWLNDSLINNTFIQWDHDSNLPSINFLYSNKLKNNYFKINIKVDKLGKSYHKINKIFVKNILHLRQKFIKKQEKKFGKSSNNTNPKKGVKLIANSFRLMNKNHDKNFNNALNVYPFFKLTYKRVPKGELKKVFSKNSKLIKLINQNN